MPVNGCGGDVDEGVEFSEVDERPTYRPESPLASHSTRMWHVQKDYTRTGCQNGAGISDGSVPQCHNLRSCTMGMLSNQLGTSQRRWVSSFIRRRGPGDLFREMPTITKSERTYWNKLIDVRVLVFQDGFQKQVQRAP